MPACLFTATGSGVARACVVGCSVYCHAYAMLLASRGLRKINSGEASVAWEKHAPRRTQNLSGNVFLGCAEKRRKRPIPRQIKPQPVERIRDGLCRRHSPEADMAPAPLAPPRADGRTRLTGLTAGGEGFMFSCGC